MPHLFTVKWPLFARLEAVLLFPVSLPLASEIARVQVFVDRRLVPEISPLGSVFGIPKPALGWIALALVVTIPYFAMLLVADRLLTVRKGFFFLSVVAIAAWAAAAAHMSDQLAAILPGLIFDRPAWLALDQEICLIAAGAALIPHLWPIWVGLQDQGDVAMRLIAAREEEVYGMGPDSRTRHLQDVYYRQTADFRGWHPQEQLAGLSGTPRENSAVKIVSAVTWIGVITAGAFAYHHWDNFALGGREPSPVPGGIPLVAEQVVPQTTGHTIITGTTSTVNGMPLSPLTQSRDSHSITTGTMPAVQHPGELPVGLQPANVYSGPTTNEATADRAPDGSFAFDVVVNGSHVPMLFDTGASAVSLRAEDATRIGVDVGRLRYSARVKTANGMAEVAPIVIDQLTVGSITQHNVSGFVAKQGALQMNLLGQSFLTRLSGYNVERNQLVLKGR